MRKSLWFWISVSLVIILSAILGRVNDFNFALWSVDYSFGFVRRGLFGELMGWFFTPPYSPDILSHLFAFFFLGFGVLSAWYFWKSSSVSKLTAFVILCGGFYLQQFGYDQGKFDIFLLSLFIINILVVDKYHGLKRVLILLAITTLALTMHEGAALLLVPGTLALLFIQREESRQKYKSIAMYWITSVVIFAVVYVAGSSDLTPAERYHYASGLMPFLTADNDVFNIAGRTLAENMSWALGRFSEPKTISRMLLNFVAVFPYIVLLSLMVRALWRTSKESVIGLALIIASVIPMYLLGIDFYRWNAFLFTLSFIFVVYAGSLHKVEYRVPLPLLTIALVFALWSGPLGVSTALPQRGFLFGLLSL